MKRERIKITALAILAVLLLCFAFGCAQNTDYLSWTYAEWSKATEVEKLQCASKYIEALDVENESALSAKAYVSIIDAGLKQNPGKTVGELAEIANSING